MKQDCKICEGKGYVTDILKTCRICDGSGFEIVDKPKEQYEHISHFHCFNNPKNPCGLKGNHCCLCDITPPTNKEKHKCTRCGEFENPNCVNISIACKGKYYHVFPTTNTTTWEDNDELITIKKGSLYKFILNEHKLAQEEILSELLSEFNKKGYYNLGIEHVYKEVEELAKSKGITLPDKE